MTKEEMDAYQRGWYDGFDSGLGCRQLFLRGAYDECIKFIRLCWDPAKSIAAITILKENV